MNDAQKAIIAKAEANRASIEGTRGTDPDRKASYGGGVRRGWHVQATTPPPKPKE